MSVVAPFYLCRISTEFSREISVGRWFGCESDVSDCNEVGADIVWIRRGGHTKGFVRR
jgi:hypothetical protein